jgi:Cd2+/Zn2+-exporting ATPase
MIDGCPYIVGNHALIEERGICTPEVEALLGRLEGEGKTAIILGTPEEVLGVIALADLPRSESARVIAELRAQGIRRIVMISGDNEGTARHVAAQFGIDEVYANVLPAEKVGHVKRLRDRVGRVAMVGDGINDAPALSAANVGIAMGGSGTDVTVETADVVLMTDDLSKIPYLVSLGRRTRSIIKQNITIALVTKLIFLGLGVSGIASLWLAVLADDGATILVIMNGLRLLRKLRSGGLSGG